MKPRFFATTVLLFLALVLLPAAGIASVTDDVKRVVDEVLRIVSSKELKKPQNERKRRAELKKSIATIFDYAEMSKLSMGAQWRSRTPEEQKEFVQLFETLLENSYAGKIEAYTNEKIVYGRESLEGDHAEVRSKVATARGEEITLDYRLKKEGSRWMVYDVVIEGVSLVANYRSQFNRIIQTQGYAELVKKLRLKSEEFKAP
jgi:phospholipid transport system substrate-binding protein